MFVAIFNKIIDFLFPKRFFCILELVYLKIRIYLEAIKLDISFKIYSTTERFYLYLQIILTGHLLRLLFFKFYSLTQLLFSKHFEHHLRRCGLLVEHLRPLFIIHKISHGHFSVSVGPRSPRALNGRVVCVLVVGQSRLFPATHFGVQIQKLAHLEPIKVLAVQFMSFSIH